MQLYAQDTTQYEGNTRANYYCKNFQFSVIDLDPKVEPNQVYFIVNNQRTMSEAEAQSLKWDLEERNNYILAYLVNTTDNNFYAKKQDGSLIMIQEAMDENGNWQPIEYWVYSGCGNSYFNPLDLASQQYIAIPIRKYSGSFDTQIRLKLKASDELIIYSEPFEGSIHKAQLNKQTKSVNGILYRGPASYLNN